jgi:hypothetical protein
LVPLYRGIKIGVTDGDGCFNIYINKDTKKISFKLKISQSIYNIKLINYLKKESLKGDL